MSLHKQPELKNAVLNLPQKEKDKLLVRLVSKDKMLMKQLHFQLLENQLDLEDRIENLRESLRDLFSTNRYTIKNIPQYSNYKELQTLLRQGSGLINEHEKVTKDKYSEMECRIYLLKEAFERFPRLFEASGVHAAFKLQIYVKARLKTTSNKFDKLHEDLQFDLSDDMQQVLDFANSNHLI
ncbi:hypothetical protein [Sphingobacterium paludis]|jgi:hypothetical protein|uniref:Uncharacterized protein n=1 Tax=Sphingobacterium paludis TaxID=1476465 RepID=A0A4R7D4N1_9SPHI|nr:hypothetical protein [Sphingobacterium paludis]TDS13826.1 hypothetical protein B0I21_104152 [Sphingobacterium paludis]